MVIAVLQSGIGASSIILTGLLHYNLFDVQGVLNVSVENVHVYMLLLSVFGFFSIVSGFFLIYR